MGIQVEYNPDLALRAYEEFVNGNRQEAECLPETLTAGTTYSFLKRDQRLYWLHGELPLLETKGSEQLSLPLASIIILEATHLLIENKMWTKGKYKIIEVFENSAPHFNGFAKI